MITTTSLQNRDSFIINRDIFIEKMIDLFTIYDNQSALLQFQEIDISAYPDNIIEENGFIILNYKNDNLQTKYFLDYILKYIP